MNLINPSERALDKITVDLYNNKVIVHGSEDTTLTFRCSSVTEMINLMQECKRILKTDNVIIR